MTLLDLVLGILEIKSADPGGIDSSRRKLKLSVGSKAVVVAFWLSLVLGLYLHLFVTNTCPRSPNERSGHTYPYSLTKYVTPETVYLTFAEHIGVDANATVLCVTFLFVVGMGLTKAE